jgi:hypothetical protein
MLKIVACVACFALTLWGAEHQNWYPNEGEPSKYGVNKIL